MFGLIGLLGMSVVSAFIMATIGVADTPGVVVVRGIAITLMWASLQAVMATVVYHDLRRKEGIEPDELAAIFD